MKSKSILIVGCGRVGTLAGKQLLKQNHHVCGTVRSRAKFSKLEDTGITPYIFDLEEDIDSSLASINWDVVVVSIPPKEPQSLVSLVTFLDKVQPGQVIVTSSTAVYPDTKTEVYEQDAIHQISKHSGVDVFAYEKQYERFKPVILRYGGLLDDGYSMLRYLAKQHQIKDGLSKLNVTHVADAAQATVFCISSNLQNNAFNVVFPTHPVKQVFYSGLAQKAGITLPLFEQKEGSFKIVDSQRIIRHGFSFQQEIQS